MPAPQTTAEYTVEQIRNVAITGHSGAGKTTLIEAVLAKLGAITRQGTVEEGNTVCDFEPEEQEHKHSLSASFVSAVDEGCQLRLIDTPGMPDFMGQAFGVLPAVESVAVVIAADKGIQTTTRRIMRVAGERKLPRMIIVNKIDEHVGELEALLEQITNTFGSECLPINMPTPDGSDVVDLWERSDGEVAFGTASEGHTRILDQIVEIDEELMATYLEQGESLDKKQLHDAFEKALCQGHIIPVLFTSATTGAGLDDLLHLLAELAPSPLEGNPRPFIMTEADGTSHEWHASAKPDDSLLAHVFRVANDQFVGKLAMVRIHQGTLNAGDTVFIDENKKGVRIAHIHVLQGKDHHEVSRAIPGDIVALTKVEGLSRSSVLHASHDYDHVRFKPLPVPRPMFGVAIEAKSHADEAKLSDALHKLTEEDPTFQVERINATKETVARGMGEMHVRVIFERLKSRFKLELESRPPKVAYKETVMGSAEGHHRHKKQTGGAGQFGEVKLVVEPAQPDEHGHTPDLEFIDDTVGGSVPKQFMAPIEKGVRQAMADGVIAGYPLGGVRVRVIDGKHHPVDSKEIAFISAGKRAFMEAVKAAKPALLEPICDVEVTAPASSLGDITADLSGKRGQVISTDILPGEMCHVHAKVPLSEMGMYTGQLKSMTGGQGAFVMDYSHDEQAPPNVQQQVIAAHEEELIEA